MPNNIRKHSYKVAGPWIDNLVPEDEQGKQLWARRFGENSSDAFTLLKHMGVDAPGAVQILPTGTDPSTQGDYTEILDCDMALRLREIRETKNMWVPQTAENITFSLPGQQSKFAIAKQGNIWLEPNGRAPSTHIVKPGMQSLRSTKHDDQ